MFSVLPTGRMALSWSTRSSFACSRSGMSPISSSSSVPPSAAWNAPDRACADPGSTPVAWPNSSDSSSSSAVSSQLIEMNGLWRRGLPLWIALASSSLPVPLSPVISTRASVPATMCAWASRSSITELRVMISLRQSSPESLKPEMRSARCTWSSSSCLSMGLVRKPKAPIWVACTASGIVPCAVSMMTFRPG